MSRTVLVWKMTTKRRPFLKTERGNQILVSIENRMSCRVFLREKYHETKVILATERGKLYPTASCEVMH